MEANKELDDILRLLDSRRLSEAMELLGTFGCKYPELNLTGPLDDIRSDYAVSYTHLTLPTIGG